MMEDKLFRLDVLETLFEKWQHRGQSPREGRLYMKNI